MRYSEKLGSLVPKVTHTYSRDCASPSPQPLATLSACAPLPPCSVLRPCCPSAFSSLIDKVPPLILSLTTDAYESWWDAFCYDLNVCVSLKFLCSNLNPRREYYQVGRLRSYEVMSAESSGNQMCALPYNWLCVDTWLRLTQSDLLLKCPKKGLCVGEHGLCKWEEGEKDSPLISQLWGSELTAHGCGGKSHLQRHNGSKIPRAKWNEEVSAKCKWNSSKWNEEIGVGPCLRKLNHDLGREQPVSKAHEKGNSQWNHSK
jgi:hypothetical protein